MEGEADVNKDTAETSRPTSRMLDRLSVNRLPPIVEDKEEVNRDTSKAPKPGAHLG